MIEGTLYTITFDGHEARITPKLPEPAAERMRAVLSYEPAGAEWAPNHKGNQWKVVDGKRTFNKAAHWDGRVSLFKKGRRDYNHFPTGLIGLAMRTLNNVASYIIKSEVPTTEPTGKSIDGKVVNLKGKKITITLADHQKKVVDVLLTMSRAMAEVPTGGGKSIIIADLLARFPDLNHLVTVPSKSLMHQTAKDLSDLLGEKVGRWGDNIFEPARVTVAIIDSVYSGIKKADRVAFLAKQDTWTGDESHLSATDRYVAVSEHLHRTQRRWGVSATLRREDCAEMKFNGIFGPEVIKITPMELIDAGWLVRPRIEMHLINHSYQHDVKETGKKKPTWSDVYKSEVVFHPARNLKIVELCERIKRERRLPCLILITDLEHGEQLHDLISNVGPCAFLQGEDDQKIRDAVLKKLPTLEVEFVVASKIFDIGVDIPELRSLILAGSGQSVSRAIQRVGRGLRADRSNNKLLIPKDQVLIIDFDDNEMFFLKNHAMARKWWYELKYEGCVTVWHGDHVAQKGHTGFPG